MRFRDVAAAASGRRSTPEQRGVVRSGTTLGPSEGVGSRARASWAATAPWKRCPGRRRSRSEEHTSELQSHSDLVCRLLLEKKKKKKRKKKTKGTNKKRRHKEKVIITV